jgi:hypothetical protein
MQLHFGKRAMLQEMQKCLKAIMQSTESQMQGSQDLGSNPPSQTRSDEGRASRASDRAGLPYARMTTLSLASSWD